MDSYGGGDRPSCWCMALILALSIAYLLSFYFCFDYVFWPLLWLSVSTAAVYAIDKVLAVWQCFRIPELILHLMGIGGGWPGAQIGQIIFHHKTSKLSFQIPFRVTVAINIFVFVVLACTVFHPDRKNDPWQSNNSADTNVPGSNETDNFNITSLNMTNLNTTQSVIKAILNMTSSNVTSLNTTTF